VPTKRTPTGRPPQAVITPEVVALFVRGLELRSTYEKCLRHSCGRRQFCDECDEYIEIKNRLDLLLARPPWEEELMDATCDKAPKWMDARRSESYRQSRDLYLALEAAADDRDP
jgi:hypothetical protein